MAWPGKGVQSGVHFRWGASHIGGCRAVPLVFLKPQGSHGVGISILPPTCSPFSLHSPLTPHSFLHPVVVEHPGTRGLLSAGDAVVTGIGFVLALLEHILQWADTSVSFKGKHLKIF